MLVKELISILSKLNGNFIVKTCGIYSDFEVDNIVVSVDKENQAVIICDSESVSAINYENNDGRENK